ncbi:patatin-like phospholipase family protein [Bradyrhizobium sp.]|uniref:patatin-like phospholipase family protein n=1 Tax=Bradyrhizobium sp. TaxID=376 RepID=UPI003C6A4C57
MTHPARTALVLQGGGALGAFEFGAVRALYEKNLAPDVIAGVSIGAITAVLLARPAGGKPLDALAAFWKKVTVPGELLPPPLRPYASFWGNPHFFTPRLDYLNWLTWTYFYHTEPLRRTLGELVDIDKLQQPGADPLLLVSATNVAKGEIEYFDSRQGLQLDHIMASGSLPPAFPMTVIDQPPPIGEQSYWDGGLFDNTPLGAVLDRLDPSPDAERTIYVVNLFPNKGPLPGNMPGVAERMKNLQFANKTLEDIKLLCRFNEVAELMQALDSLPDDHAIKQHAAYQAMKRRGYVRVPRIVAITPPEPSEEFADADFSPEALVRREKQGYDLAQKALAAGPQDPCSLLNDEAARAAMHAAPTANPT